MVITCEHFKTIDDIVASYLQTFLTRPLTMRYLKILNQDGQTNACAPIIDITKTQQSAKTLVPHI